jgi:hypothetical protein
MFGGMNGGNMADMMGEEDAEFVREMGGAAAGNTETSSKPAEPSKPPQPDPKANLTETQKQVIKMFIYYM